MSYMVERELQTATLGNDNVAEGNDTPYYIPYAIATFTLLGCGYLFYQYGHYWFCRIVCGREDPIDVDELLSGLTKEQRKEVLGKVIEKRTTIISTDENASQKSLCTEVNEKDEEKSSGALKTGDPKGNTLPSPSDTSLDGSIPDIENALSPQPEDGGSDEDDSEMKNPQHLEGPSPVEKEPTEAEDSDDEDENVCPICLCCFEEKDRVFESEHCSHKFHEDCILEWLCTKDRMDCPVCRVDIVSQDDMISPALEVVKRDRAAANNGSDLPRKSLAERIFSQ